MSRPDHEPLSPYFGDYPDGAYWSAHPPPGYVHDDSPDYTVEGDTIRFMWDYGVTVPLWVTGGLVPDDKEWLRRALGLRYPLVRDLRAWGEAMNELDADPRLRTDEAYAELDRQARALVERVQAAVGERFTVTYHPW